MDAYIVCFCAASDDYGVYENGYRNSYGTNLSFRGTLAECVAYRKDYC